jgi:non-heme chloroperoxidase
MVSTIKTADLSNQVRLPYVEQGESSGVPLILLHGYADSWHSFERVLPYLPKFIHTFTLTQRGHGDASRPITGYQTQDFVADLLAFMDVLHLNASVIAGGSSGGFVARRFAIDYPERTLGLVLIGSPLRLRDKPTVLQLWHSTISKLTDPIDPGFVREFVKNIFTQPMPKSFLETLVQESMKVPARVWKATLEGLLEDNSSEELDKIKSPTLIVWGDKDTIVPRSDQETFNMAIANSQLLIYPSAGHVLYCEEPARFASDVTDFIKKLMR